MLEILLDTGKIALDRELYVHGNIFTLACGMKDCPVSLLRRMALSNRNLIDTRPTNSLYETPLLRFAETKNVAAMEMLLEVGANVYLTNTEGDTALHIAAKLDDDSQNVPVVMMRALLRAKMDVDTKTERGVTALMLACEKGDIKRVEILLEEGASVFMTNDEGWSVLEFAARGGHSDVVTRLLRTSALPQTDLDRALMMATARGFCNVIRVLTSAGVSSNTAAEDQTTALMSAAKGGHLEAARMLIENGATVNAWKADGTSSLMLTCSGKFKDVIGLLLDNGATVNHSNEQGETALLCLMRAKLQTRTSRISWPDGAEEILPMLLERGSDVSASTVDGNTAVSLVSDPGYPDSDDARLLFEAGADPALAERNARIDLISSDRIYDMDSVVLELLLNAGVDPNKGRRDGVTALMAASRAGQVQKVKILLGGGASVDAVDCRGQTALIQASGASVLKPEIVKELLNAGANTNHEANDGKTAFFYLVSRQDRYVWANEVEEIFNLLAGGGAVLGSKAKDGDTLLMCAARDGDSTTVQLVLAAGADHGGRDEDGRTALMVASMLEGASGAHVVEMLLDAGVDLHDHDFHGNTALMYAAEQADPVPSTIKTLLAAGANPNLANKVGETALMKSAASPFLPSDKVNTLLDAGADVNAVDGKGRSVLHWAVKPRFYELGYVVEATCRVPGVILDQKDNAGETALARAERKGNEYGVKFIRDAIRRRDCS